MRKNPSLKTLVVLDKDNCELDTLEIFGALEETLAQLAVARDIDVQVLYDLTRGAEGEHRFNDALRLIDYFNEVEPRFKTDKEAHRQADIAAKKHWLKKTSELSRFYPGNLNSLQTWHDRGTNVVTKTDCERLPLIRRIWLTALNANNIENADKHNSLLLSPYEIIPLYDRIYCKPSLGEPENERAFEIYLRRFCEASGMPFSFAAALNEHITVFRDEHKPSLNHMQQILSDFPTPHDRVLYIGDNYKDGLEAQVVNPAIDFAWAKYGAGWRDEVRDFYQKVGSKSYSYGLGEITRAFNAHSVSVHTVLETSLADVFDHYDFRAGWNLPRRPLEDALNIQNRAARNLRDFRAQGLNFQRLMPHLFAFPALNAL